MSSPGPSSATPAGTSHPASSRGSGQLLKPPVWGPNLTGSSATWRRGVNRTAKEAKVFQEQSNYRLSHNGANSAIKSHPRCAGVNGELERLWKSVAVRRRTLR